MAEPKKKFPRHTSPVGVVCGFTSLAKPDTKFKAEGVYHTKLRFEPAAVASFVAQADELAKAKLAEVLAEKPKLKKVAKTVPTFKPELDDDGDETGNLTASFKMAAQVKSKKDGSILKFKPAMFDARGKAIPLVNPWGGSELKVNFEMVPYFNEKDKEAGVSFRLYAVQVLKLVSGGNGDAESYGFGEEEGWTADEDTASPEKTDEATSEDDASEDDADF